eukprot:672204_1
MGRKQSKRSSKARQPDREEIFDEVDDFSELREHIPLDSKDVKAAESDDSMDEELLEMSGASSDSESAGDARAGDESVWGTRADAYYNADTAKLDLESDGEEMAREEEEEAKRLHGVQMERMDEEDFEDDDMIASLLKKGKLAKSSPETSQTAETSKDMAEFTKEMNSVVLPGINQGKAVAERIHKDISSMTKDAKLQLLLSSAPELLGMAEELKVRLVEWRDECAPLCDELVAAALGATDESSEEARSLPMAVRYVRARYHLLLMYCVHLSMYLALKAEGRELKSHPIVEEILQLRKLLDSVESHHSDLFSTATQMLADHKAGKPTELTRATEPAETTGDVSSSSDSESETDSETLSGDNDVFDLDSEGG